MQIKKIMILISFLGLNVYGGTEGHGGDSLRLLFEDARPFAADRVLKAESCAFGSNVSSEVRSWILNHKQALADDILQSAHVWVTGQQSTCAFTQTSAKSDITLSFEACRPGVRHVSDALKILVHESVHHFGIVDEYFADRVADAIFNLGIHSSCAVQPSENPFDPASCPGAALSSEELKKMIPLPDANEKKLGRLQVYGRQRVCYSQDWCTPWSSKPDEMYFYFDRTRNGSHFVPRQGVVGVQLRSNNPEVVLRGDEFKYEGVASSYWGAIADIDDSSKLSVNLSYVLRGGADLGSPSGDLAMNRVKLKGERLVSGWMTNQCLRLTSSNKIRSQDSKQNDIIVEYESVILSNW